MTHLNTVPSYEPDVRRVRVIFACRSCGTAYETFQKHIRASGKFDCIACNADVHAWNGFYDFTNWTAVTFDK